MTTTLDSLPKPAKALPEEAQVMFVEAYNKDFAWRCSESHAEKAAWQVVRSAYKFEDDAWVSK